MIVLGVPALLSPGEINPEAFQRDYWVMLAVSVVFTLLCLGRKHRIGHLAGALLLCGFITYLAVLFCSHKCAVNTFPYKFQCSGRLGAKATNTPTA